MAIKLTDVAKKAGVSTTTVSRVINNYGYLSQKTIDKVHAAMSELNYQPNALARSLQGKKSQLIGVIFPSVSNPFFGELIERIEELLFNNGYKTILCDCAHDGDKEKEYLNLLIANQVDGIITGSHNLGIDEYQNLELPIVSFDRFLAEGIPIVGSDNYKGGTLATNLLIDKGCKKIGFFSGTNKSGSPTNQRLHGYYDTLKKFDLTPHIFEFPDSISSLVKRLDIANILIKEDLDSVFCTDDLTALLVISEAEKINKLIPENFKVIGYDGTQIITNHFPKLTTIAQPIEEYAQLLVNLLLQRIDASPKTTFDNQYKLPVKIVYGNTV